MSGITARAKAQSKETEFAGLPKACKVIGAAAQGLAAGWANCAFDTLRFNYGGYTFLSGGGAFIYTTILIPEPGVYEWRGGYQLAAGNLHLCGLNINGTLGAAGMDEYGVNGSVNTAFPPRAVSTGIAELKTGDTLNLQIYNDVAVVNTIAGACWFYIEKKERGQ